MYNLSVCSADSIEANVEATEGHVQSGTQQLAYAADRQVKLNRTENVTKRTGRYRWDEFMNVRDFSLKERLAPLGVSDIQQQLRVHR